MGRFFCYGSVVQEEGEDDRALQYKEFNSKDLKTQEQRAEHTLYINENRQTLKETQGLNTQENSSGNKTQLTRLTRAEQVIQMN